MIDKDDQRTAPANVVAAVRSILENLCKFCQPSQPPPAERHASINAPFLEAWREMASDPGSEVTMWLYSGALAGISMQPLPCGIFQEIGGSPEIP